MNIRKKILGVFLVLTIFITLYSPIALADSNTSINYLALGDSIAYGYGLEDIDTQSYAQIVRGKNSISKSNFSNLAVSGMTCEEFYRIIQTTKYTNAIKSANLITISIGSNELLEIASEAVSTVTNVPTTDVNFLDKAKAVFAKASLAQKLKLAKDLYNYFTSNETKAKINHNIQVYNENWNNSIAYIKSINPNATIVATQFYNPYYEIGLSSYDLGSFVAEFIEKMNVILENSSNSESLYKIARIYDDFNTTSPRLTNVNINLLNYSQFNLDPHPNKNGHNVIATRILDVLKSNSNTKIDIKNLSFSEIKDYTYTGSEITPKVVIKSGNTVLTENEDYTLTYINNVDVGQASVVIKGIGNYFGTVVKTFNIKSKEIKQKTNLSTLQFSKIEDQLYLGFQITPDVEIVNNKTKLKLDKDYTLSYYNNINAGVASITVSGIGDYIGTKDLTFKISPQNISYASILDIEPQLYKNNPLTPSISISYGSNKLVENIDYKLSYSNNSSVGTATINIIGIGNYTGSTTKSFEIIQEQEPNTSTDISTLPISDIEDKIYTGKVITPEVTIYDGEKLLAKDEDYILSYTNNINIGTGNVTITGINDYTGSVQKDFLIVKKDIDYAQIIDIPDQEPTNSDVKPPVIILNDGTKLKENQDYTIKYSNDSDEKTGKISIKGINNYKGSTVKTYNIKEKTTTKEENTIKEDTPTTIEQNAVDDTADKELPYAGISYFFYISLLLIIIGGTFSFINYRKYK